MKIASPLNLALRIALSACVLVMVVYLYRHVRYLRSSDLQAVAAIEKSGIFEVLEKNKVEYFRYQYHNKSLTYPGAKFVFDQGFVAKAKFPPEAKEIVNSLREKIDLTALPIIEIETTHYNAAGKLDYGIFHYQGSFPDPNGHAYVYGPGHDVIGRSRDSQHKEWNEAINSPNWFRLDEDW